ncbi:MAG: NAD-dependent epimerase/dehydratase family protein [Streptosporangiales bacterium]|nr:NAD-dependent epimerase/dehydratase family protein [Streptosporangiales bacterium]
MRAFVIGGSGLVGRAICRRLVSTGWEVDVVGRDAARLPADLAASGAEFVAADRDDATALAAAFGGGADLLVDCVCFTRAQAETLVPLARNATSTVMLSSKAVYVDAAGRHANSDNPPHYDGPIPETQPTQAPGDMDFRSREGYGPNKVAAEQILLDSGLPVTVLRASKVHGEGARPPREWVFVKRVLDRRRSVLLAHRGRGVDHPSAAVNIATLVETVAHKGGRRILNCADPDAPNGADIARIIARHLAHEWEQVLLDDDADPSLGWHPWDSPSPVILDTSAATELGYRPVGDYQATVVDTIDWLTRTATMAPDGARLPAGLADDFPDAFDYAHEDRSLRTR